MTYGRTVTVRADFDDVVDRVKAAFGDEGFGTLTEIDVQETLATKIGEQIEPYVILGVCNPNLAFRALEMDRLIGLLLPCTVVVRGDGDAAVVSALDPQMLVSVTDNPDLEEVAAEAGRRIDAALDAIDANLV